MLRSEDEGVRGVAEALRPIHPHPAQLERFFRSELSRGEARSVVRHLLARCPVCLPVTRRLWGLGGGR